MRVFIVNCLRRRKPKSLLGGGRVIMNAVLIEQQVREFLNWGFAAALSVVLLVATLVVYGLVQRLLRPRYLEGAR